ncbi:MAG: uncharacterized protein KVP18_002629 [Porospora cf. gigantea A]|uniref:uncharacterized protein n=1 Tax=Porospora cf. gigantea A TaxID=2853593 RepID=UPI00355950FD|nr:MAG: hypothetical protein KVP18_002629 [Porospora cf. gigantea A]
MTNFEQRVLETRLISSTVVESVPLADPTQYELAAPTVTQLPSDYVLADRRPSASVQTFSYPSNLGAANSNVPYGSDVLYAPSTTQSGQQSQPATYTQPTTHTQYSGALSPPGMPHSQPRTYTQYSGPLDAPIVPPQSQPTTYTQSQPTTYTQPQPTTYTQPQPTTYNQSPPTAYTQYSAPLATPAVSPFAPPHATYTTIPRQDSFSDNKYRPREAEYLSRQKATIQGVIYDPHTVPCFTRDVVFTNKAQIEKSAVTHMERGASSETPEHSLLSYDHHEKENLQGAFTGSKSAQRKRKGCCGC